LILSAAGGCADEVKFDRSIKKEPTYQSNDPRYCLLAFGSEGNTSVWVVFDSVPDPLKPGDEKDYLYVDRNGNGDLTEPGKRVPAIIHKQKVVVSFGKGFYEETLLEFDVGAVGNGKDKYDGLKVWVSWYRGKERPCRVSFKNEKAYAREESVSEVIFSKKRQDAPILRFDGQLTMRFALGKTPTFSVDQECKIEAEIGSNGRGPDSFVSMRYDAFPKDRHPIAEIEWPNREAGKPPIKQTVELDQHC